MWQAVRDGMVDCIGSDHAPHTQGREGAALSAKPSGMPGVQTLLPIMLDHVHEGRLTLQRLIDLTSAGPARIYNIGGKGRIALGYDADLSVVDLKAKRTITNDWMATKGGWTPYHGMDVTGWPVATIVRGGGSSMRWRRWRLPGLRLARCGRRIEHKGGRWGGGGASLLRARGPGCVGCRSHAPHRSLEAGGG